MADGSGGMPEWTNFGAVGLAAATFLGGLIYTGKALLDSLKERVKEALKLSEAMDQSTLALDTLKLSSENRTQASLEIAAQVERLSQVVSTTSAENRRIFEDLRRELRDLQQSADMRATQWETRQSAMLDRIEQQLRSRRAG